ncbi:MAG: 4-hydroxy-tetrahydrodipicolinate reductase [Planctomycetota bacterium]
MRRVVVVGARGRMGAVVAAGVREAPDLDLAAEVDLGDDLAAVVARRRPDVAVDFTTPGAVLENARTVLEGGAHAVVGTTGLGEAELGSLDALARARGRTCLVAPNFAIGAILAMRFAEEAARHLPRVEIIERHHEGKLDAPSGTARLTAERVAAARRDVREQPAGEESAPGARGGRVAGVPVHSLRLPGSVAHQEVWLGGPGETLVLRHDVVDRRAFVPGVLLALRGVGAAPGLVRGIEGLL